MIGVFFPFLVASAIAPAPQTPVNAAFAANASGEVQNGVDNFVSEN